MTLTVNTTSTVEYTWLPLDQIDLSAKGRPISATAVAALAESIKTIGLQSPLVLVERYGNHILIAGRHRLEALRALGEERAPCRIVDFNDVEARLWTISENLHRAELTVLSRSEQIAEFAQLMKERLARDGVAQLTPKPQGGRPEGGDRLVARKLGIDRRAIERSKAIASLPEEVKAKAVDLGLADNQSALMEAAKAPTPKAQAETIERRADPDRPVQPVVRPLRNLDNLAGGEFARWIKLTTPHKRTHVIRVLRMAADILEDELQAAPASRSNDADAHAN
jgi:ParB-like chromosome segregation protein Spo0J